MSSVSLSFDQREADRFADLIVTSVLTHATRAVGAATRGLEKDLEALTRTAVPGNLWKAWKSDVYPRAGRPSYAPAGEVYVNGGPRSQGAMTFWTQPGVNRARDGQWLAIPTVKAGARGRGRNLTPGEWERRSGVRLQFVYGGGSGKPSFLVARQVLSGANGRGVRAATDKRRQGGRYQGAKTQDVIIFVLIAMQRFGNKFSVAPAIDRRRKMLNDDFARRVARVNAAGGKVLGD